MGIKYSMEGFIKYFDTNTMGNSKRGFTDHNASARSLILRSIIMIADDNMQDQQTRHQAQIHGRAFHFFIINQGRF